MLVRIKQATINQKNYFGYNPFYSQKGNTKISLNRDESAKSLNRTGSRHSTYSTRSQKLNDRGFRINKSYDYIGKNRMNVTTGHGFETNRKYD